MKLSHLQVSNMNTHQICLLRFVSGTHNCITKSIQTNSNNFIFITPISYNVSALVSSNFLVAKYNNMQRAVLELFNNSEITAIIRHLLMLQIKESRSHPLPCKERTK